MKYGGPEHNQMIRDGWATENAVRDMDNRDRVRSLLVEQWEKYYAFLKSVAEPAYSLPSGAPNPRWDEWNGECALAYDVLRAMKIDNQCSWDAARGVNNPLICWTHHRAMIELHTSGIDGEGI